MMSKKAITQTIAVLTILALIIAILAGGLIYYATLRHPGPSTITGTVTDEETEDPISGATVKLDGLAYITGSDGTYSFSVDLGDYTLTVSKTGYEGETDSVSVTEEKEYTVDFALTATRIYKLALMVGGDETDLGFSYMAIQGANNISEKYGWEVSISRLVAYADQAHVASDYAERGYDVVFAVGGQFISTIYFEVPTDYNDTYFVQIPGLSYPLPPDNVAALHPAFQTVGHYLAGVLSAEMTETNAVAWVCGEWYPYLAMEFWAFVAGVDSVNSDVDVYCRVAGSWGDASLGYQIADSLITTNNVDIIVQVADLTGRGIFAACQANDVKIIGTVADQVAIAPSVTLTSIMMDTPRFMEMVVQRIINGTWDEIGGTAVDVDLSYLAPFHNFEDVVPQATKDLLAATEEDIEDGTIVVPRTVTATAPSEPV